MFRTLSQTSLTNPYWGRQSLDSTGRSRSLFNFISLEFNEDDLRPLLNDSDRSLFNNNSAVSLFPPPSRVVSGQPQEQEEPPPPSYTLATPPPNHPPPPYNHRELPLYSNLSWFIRFKGYVLRSLCLTTEEVNRSAQIDERRSAIIIFRAQLVQKQAALARLYTERRIVWNDLSRNRASRAFIMRLNLITNDIFKTQQSIDKLTNKIEKLELKIIRLERELDTLFQWRWELQNAGRTQ